MQRAPLWLLRGGSDRSRAAGWIGRPLKESDVLPDEQVIDSREYGAVRPGDKVGDAGTATRTANNDLLVGGAGGDDLGYAADSGAEIRAGASPPSQEDPDVRSRLGMTS